MKMLIYPLSRLILAHLLINLLSQFLIPLTVNLKLPMRIPPVLQTFRSPLHAVPYVKLSTRSTHVSNSSS